MELSDLTYLYVYKDKSGVNQADLVTAIPSDDWLASRSNSYSGLIFIEDWNGNPKIGYEFKNGQLIHRLKGEAVSSTDKSAKLVALTTDYYYYVGGGSGVATYSYSTTTIYDDGTGDGPMGPPSYESIVTTGGGGGGGNTSGSSAPKLIDILVTDPCLKNNLTAMIQSGCVRVSYVLDQMFSTSDVLNLTFRQSSTLANNVDGLTVITKDAPDIHGVRNVNVTVFINVNNKSKSKEYTTATYLHEGIHAYLDASPNYQATLNQHAAMGDSYVSWMIQGLRQMYPSLTYQDAAALSLQGLQTNPNIDTIIGYYGFTSRSQVGVINDAYANKNPSTKKGTYCN